MAAPSDDFVRNSTVSFELYWQGSCKYGNDSDISSLEIRMEGMAEEILARINTETNAKEDERLPLIFSVSRKMEAERSSGQINCPIHLARRMEITARIFREYQSSNVRILQPNGSDVGQTRIMRTDLEVVVAHPDAYEPNGAYCINVRCDGRAIRARIEKQIGAVAHGAMAGAAAPAAKEREAGEFDDLRFVLLNSKMLAEKNAELERDFALLAITEQSGKEAPETIADVRLQLERRQMRIGQAIKAFKSGAAVGKQMMMGRINPIQSSRLLDQIEKEFYDEQKMIDDSFPLERAPEVAEKESEEEAENGIDLENADYYQLREHFHDVNRQIRDLRVQGINSKELAEMEQVLIKHQLEVIDALKLRHIISGR